MENVNSSERLNHDPDYCVPLENNKNQQNICEQNARSTAEKISKILETEFSKEIETKKKEVFKIYETLQKACKIMHYLRYTIVTDFYNQESHFTEDAATRQPRLHPTVNAITKKVNLNVDCENDCFRETPSENTLLKRKIDTETNPSESNEPRQKIAKKDLEAPPLINGKIKITVVVGNYSKWIPPDSREQNDATHKWTVYLIDSQKRDLGDYVSKVRFLLHPSYQPNNEIELTSPPFYLSRLGWGEFTIRVQLFFKNNRNRPADIFHTLSLDRTCTGLLTIGSETVVDIWLIPTDNYLPPVENRNNQNDSLPAEKNEDQPLIASIKVEPDEDVPTETIENEKEEVDSQEQDNSENKSDIITILSDHDYIRTNFAPIKVENIKAEASEIPSTNYAMSNKQSLLKRNYENSNCTIRVDKGKIYSSNQNHNFDELPLSDVNTKLGKRKQNYNTEQFYADPKKYSADKGHTKDIISLIERVKPKNLFGVLKLITPRIPLITEKAADQNYKVSFPYACESYQVFSNYSQGKQRALERYQALHALDIMREVQCFESSCSANEFMIWAKRYGHTPLLNLKTLRKLATTSQSIDVKGISRKYENSATISTELNNWFLKCQAMKPTVKELVNDSDDEIDIINVQSDVPNSLSCHEESESNRSNVILLDHPKKYNGLNVFVFKNAEEIGIKLINEEIIPGVSHSSASLVISKALECLVNELTRSALSCAIDRCNAEKNVDDFKVSVEDVHTALLKREEFDIFTNAGLGSDR